MNDETKEVFQKWRKLPMNDSQQSVALLQRKLARERKAREAAESQLEAYSFNIYQTNEELKASLKSAQKSQGELKFLNELSYKVSGDIKLNALLTDCMFLISDFLDATFGFHISMDDGELKIVSQYIPDSASNIDTSKVFAEIQGEISLTENADTTKWYIQPLDSIPCQKTHWLLSTAIGTAASSHSWLVIGYGEQLLDEEYLYVLDTARSQIQTGVNRRLNDARILRRNKTLQETIAHLEEAKAKLIQSEKMASLGQLAAGVAHEINNPIGFISSNLQTLKGYVNEISHFEQALNAELDSSALHTQYNQLKREKDIDFIFTDIQELIDSNLQGIHRVSEIVKGLKTFSHTNANQPFEKVSLAEVSNQALKIAWNALKYDYVVENSLRDSEYFVLGNAGQLQQVFVNLIVNAIQAMPDGGTLRISGTKTSKHLQVTVEDTGIGMDEETLSKIYTPFFTTKPNGVGTGLGLSISFGILEAHDVDISIRSEVGKGSCFILSFPLANA